MSARAADRIRALQQEADRLAAQARTVFGDLRRLEIDRAIKREEAARADADLAAITAARDRAAARLRDLDRARVAETPGLAARLVGLYTRGRGGYVRLLLSSSDVRGFGRTSRGVAAMAELDRIRIETYRRTLAAGRAALADLDARRQALGAAQKTAARARAALDAAVAARGRLIDDLDRRRDLAARFVGELQAAERVLQRLLIDPTAARCAALRLPITPFRGALDWPLRGRVVSLFGRAREGRFGTAIVRNGIEVAAAEGTPAAAVHEGTVAYAAPFAGFGTLVIVDHGGDAYSLYGHLASAEVVQGAQVARGATVGVTGLAPAGDAALYFELRIDGRPVDPLQWLRSPR